MDEQKATILAIASRILSYPSDNFREELVEIKESLKDDVCSEEVKKDLINVLTTLSSFELRELSEIYVAAFDLKKNLGLYLTAHELGDSSKRGAALIWLQKTINEAGYERVDSELADYIPMLYELLAITTVRNQERLEKRLATATYRILSYLPDENPYYGIFKCLMSFVFPTPTKEEMEKLEQDREEADLEPMPYPIMYN